MSEEEELRLLLRGLADAEPLPDEVAERLEATAARLAATRAAGPARPVRRRVVIGVAAAAAVGVVGVGLTALAHTPGSSVSAGSSAPTTFAQEQGAPGASTDHGGQAPDTTKEMIAPGASGTASMRAYDAALPTFVTGGLTRQLTAWWAGSPSLSGTDGTCPGPWLSGPALALEARLDGAPAALLVFPAQGTSQLLEIYRCDAVSSPAGTASVSPR
jgi:hypothetical protein